MPTEPLYIVGAGGHGKVVLEAALLAGFAHDLLIVVDEDPRRASCSFLSKVVESGGIARVGQGSFHVSIGDNAIRRAITAALCDRGGTPVTIVHPDASVAQSAQVSAGVFVGARAIVGPDARIGEGTILNHGSIVDHDCAIGAFCHIAPQSTLGGAVHIHENVLVGAGAIILPGLKVCDGVVIGAGAVVVRDVVKGAKMMSPIAAERR